jgi:hypothetical protein
VFYLLEEGQPIPVLLYGSKSAWRAGVVIVSNTQWYFREFHFKRDHFVEDKHGLTYFPVTLSVHEKCLVGNESDRKGKESTNNPPLLGYGLMLPHVFCNEGRYKYALLLNGWEYLDDKFGWSEV